MNTLKARSAVSSPCRVSDNQPDQGHVNGEEGMHHAYTAKLKMDLKIVTHWRAVYALALCYAESIFSIPIWPVLNFAVSCRIHVVHAVYMPLASYADLAADSLLCDSKR